MGLVPVSYHIQTYIWWLFHSLCGRWLDFRHLTYLRSHERSRVTRRHQQAIFCSQLFGKSKITNPDAFCTATVIRVADVTGLQVSMYNLKKGTKTHISAAANANPCFILETTQYTVGCASCLTPSEWRYSTVLARVQMMSDASFSVKFGTVSARSSSSLPLSKSWTRNTLWPSSNTCRYKHTWRCDPGRCSVLICCFSSCFQFNMTTRGWVHLHPSG